MKANPDIMRRLWVMYKQLSTKSDCAFVALSDPSQPYSYNELANLSVRLRIHRLICDFTADIMFAILK